MGNHRFRLSDMIPNAWFYKLKDMGKSTRNHNNSHHPIRKKHLTSSTPIAAQPTQPKQPYISQSRHSYYFTTQERIHNSPINPKFSHTHFPDPPRKSSKRKCRRRTIKSSSSSSKVVTTSASVSAGCSCRATLDSVWTKSDSTPEDDTTSPDSDLQGSLIPEFGSDPVSITDKFEGLAASWSSSCSCQVSSSTTDIIIDMDANNSNSSCRKFDKLDGFDLIPEIELPPILTKPAPKFSDMVSEIKKKETEQPIQLRRRTAKLEERNAHGGSLSVKVVKEGSIKEEKTSSPHVKRSSPVSPGLKLRANSPRIASKKIQAYSRKSVSSTMTSRSRRKNISDSFAVVKSSFDPQRDFRDSMVEMIVENNIRASKDLEELLACYLSLNSNEYHDLIVKVFEKIWFDLTDLQL